jgi:ATP-dependent Lhr-like helicase
MAKPNAQSDSQIDLQTGLKTVVLILPEPFANWFEKRNWALRSHQAELINAGRRRASTLLIAPTGAGKTLAGFLPSLIDLYEVRSSAPKNPPLPKPDLASALKSDSDTQTAARIKAWRAARKGRTGLHTLYISPLKALAVDIARNLEAPIAEMDLPIRVETRTGDTGQSKRQRQKTDPPDILLTTPEQVSLLLASREAEELFGSLDTVVLDELHALVTSKRGDLLSLALARLRKLSPNLRCVGLSATVANPDALRRYLVPQKPDEERLSELVTTTSGSKPRVDILISDERVPWSGHMGRYATGDVYELIKAHALSLIFVNTRAQAEMTFQELWAANDEGLPIALHHGSLDAASAARWKQPWRRGSCARWCVPRRSIWASTGAMWIWWSIWVRPKGPAASPSASGAPITAWTSPPGLCWCPPTGSRSWSAARPSPHWPKARRIARRWGPAGWMCWPSMCSAWPWPGRSRPMNSMPRSVLPRPMPTFPRTRFDQILDFVATGGYALKVYDRYARIRQRNDGKWRVANPQVAQRYRMNVGTIVGSELLKVRLVRDRPKARLMGGKVLGEIEEWFVSQLEPADTFMFAGQILKLQGVRETDVFVSRSMADTPKIPSYQGGKFPLSTYLAERVRKMLADPAQWPELGPQLSEWLSLQGRKSVLPKPDQLLVETFPRGGRHYLVCYPFDGRLCHQTLGMLLTRRLGAARRKAHGVCRQRICAVGLDDVGPVHDDPLGRGRSVTPARAGHAGGRSRRVAR